MVSPRKVRIPAIRAARLVRGLTQQEVAMILGCSRQMVIEIEAGKRGMSQRYKVTLAALYDVDVLEINEMIAQAKNLARKERGK